MTVKYIWLNCGGYIPRRFGKPSPPQPPNDWGLYLDRDKIKTSVLLTKNKCSDTIPNMNQNELDELIRKIAKDNTRPVIDATLREIAAQVKQITGNYEPSTSVVSAALQRIKAKATGHRWSWKHNEGKE